jgi:hypothetical protein
VHRHGDDSSDSEDEEFDDARSNRSARRPSRDYTRTSFNYSHLSFNRASGSSHTGKIPKFDETGYSKWKNSMEEYLMAVNPALWTILNRGITFPSGDATLTQKQANEIQRNYQAIRIVKSSLTSEEYDKVDGLKSAKEVWDTLFMNHEGTKQVREGRIRALESELNGFVIKDDESPQDMYNCLNKIINKIKSLGSTRWGRREVVDKILSAYMARDVQLPTLIREKRGFNKFSLADVIGKMEEHLITVKESKLSQEMSKMQEQLEKNKRVALKASSKEKRSSSSTSKTMVEEDGDEDSDMNMTPEQMTLFVRKFNKMFKKSGFFNKNKDKDKIKTKRTSKRPCFGCGKEGHFIPECPNIRVRRRDTNKNDKNKKKEVGEAHLGEEWYSNDDSSDSDVEAGLATISIGEPIKKSSLFEDLTDDEDDFTHTCLMARGSKVDTPTPHLDDDSQSDFDFENMITSFGKKATKKIMFLMKEIENREGTLEVQEELFRLEREKTIALENALVIEKKGFKVQEDLL